MHQSNSQGDKLLRFMLAVVKQALSVVVYSNPSSLVEDSDGLNLVDVTSITFAEATWPCINLHLVGQLVESC